MIRHGTARTREAAATPGVQTYMSADAETKLISDTVTDIVAILDVGTRALRSKERRADDWPLHAARFVLSASVVVACGMITLRSLSDLRDSIRRSRTSGRTSGRSEPLPLAEVRESANG